MKNATLVEIITERFGEQKMTAEYKLQLGTIVELEEAFLKRFSEEKRREYANLEKEKGQLHCIEIDLLLNFAIEFIKEARL